MPAISLRPSARHALTAILRLTVPISSRLKRFTVNQQDEALWGSANTQTPPPAIEMVNEGAEKLL